MRLPPLPALHLAVLLFGAAGIFGKLVDLSAAGIVLGRVLVAGLVLGAVLRARREPLLPERRRDVPGLVGLGLLLAVHWVTFFHAIQLSSVAVGLVTYSTFPVFVALLEPLLLREGWRWGDLAAAAVTLVGVTLVVPRIDWDTGMTRGAAWGVVSGLLFALLMIANRGYRRRYGALSLTFHQVVWASLVLLPVALPELLGASGRDLLLLVLLGVVFTAGAHGLFVAALAHIRARVAGVVATLEPVYGIALAAVILGEIPSTRTAVGGLLVLATAAWTSLRVGGSSGTGPPAPPGFA
jgi:drug/metabolite transporter (DMT)-like permease